MSLRPPPTLRDLPSIFLNPLHIGQGRFGDVFEVTIQTLPEDVVAANALLASIGIDHTNIVSHQDTIAKHLSQLPDGTQEKQAVEAAVEVVAQYASSLGQVPVTGATTMTPVSDHARNGSSSHLAVTTTTSTPHKKAAIKFISCNPKDNNYFIGLKKLYRELSILSHFQYVPQIVELQTVWMNEWTTSQGNTQTEIYLVMDRMPRDLLGSGSGARNDYHNVPMDNESAIRSVMAQLFIALSELHKNCGPHRDISPKNILLDPENCVVQICDFGLARFVLPNENLTLPVCTLNWRAPEVITDCEKYDAKVDIWSLGVICAELFMKRILFPVNAFFAGVTDRSSALICNMLARIFLLLGLPEKELLTNPKHIFYGIQKNAQNFILGLYAQQQNFRQLLWSKMTASRTVPPTLENMNWTEGTGGVQPSPLALNFLKQTICLDPEERLSARQALNHPWFEQDPEVQQYIAQEQECIVASRLNQASLRPSTGTYLADPATGITDSELLQKIKEVISHCPDKYGIRQS